MRRTRGLWISILFVLGLVAAAGAGFATGTRPVLGLDLEGGVSVILAAPQGTPADVMARALENIRHRVDAFGVAEPQIFLTGTTIEVQLPGLAQGTIRQRNQTRYCLVGKERKSFGCFETQDEAAAVLEAVTVSTDEESCLVGSGGDRLACYGAQAEADAALEAVTVQRQEGGFCLLGASGEAFGCFDAKGDADAEKEALSVESQVTRACLLGEGDRALGCFTTEGEADATLSAISVSEERTQFCVISSEGRSLGCVLTLADAEARQQATGQERLLQLIGTTARLEQRQVLQVIAEGDPTFEATPVTCPGGTQTIQEGCTFTDLEDQSVVFTSEDGKLKYRLSPVEITGDAIRRATAVLDTGSQGSIGQGWMVSFELTSDGSKTFGDLTTRLVGQQLAIVLDQEVISAPTIQEAITGGSGQITGSFSEREAKDLATVLNAGALPVQLSKQQVVTVSPTLGRESLHEGLVAGLVGLGALAIYLLFYYRLLGIVAWLGMSIWAVLAFGLVSLAGRAVDYTLTLAGVAGLVISLGVTADSYIVFFERLKDEVRHGKTPRSAVAPAFARAYKTIIAADVVTGLAAIVLYVTAISSVRGFALTLGVATGLDLFVVYFFKRPTVFLISRSERLVNLRGFGLSSGVAASPALPVPVEGPAR